MKASEIKTTQTKIVAKMSNEEVLSMKVNLSKDPILCHERWMIANDVVKAEIIKRGLQG